MVCSEGMLKSVGARETPGAQSLPLGGYRSKAWGRQSITLNTESTLPLKPEP